ncbi:MAG: helix-turn-helix domain-containing protein [Chromatocurvus sp.]
MMSAEFVKSYIEAWNAQDPTRVASHLAAGGTYHDMGALRKITRRDLISHLEEFFSLDSSRYVLIGEVLEGRETIAFQYLACPMGGDLEASGWMGAEFITLDGDSASRIEDYYGDTPSLTRARGAEARRERYAKSGLSRGAREALLRRLRNAMEKERVYLNAMLSLPELASDLGCSINHLSQAINEGHGMGFFDFVNHYRIRDAVQILSSSTECPGILDVALDVGFNSTSTFYAAFKRATGKTPAQFRRESLRGS